MAGLVGGGRHSEVGLVLITPGAEGGCHSARDNGGGITHGAER